jgi:hypothetical protein
MHQLPIVDALTHVWPWLVVIWCAISLAEPKGSIWYFILGGWGAGLLYLICVWFLLLRHGIIPHSSSPCISPIDVVSSS